MGGAWAGDMDAVLFEMKKGHLAGTRFGRWLLKPFGGVLTPARFNVLLALYEKPMRQCDLWRLLGVVRSAMSEMLEVLIELGWVKAIRAADGRTRLISLTVRGLELFELAYARCIRSGDATVEVNRALEGPSGLADATQERCGLVTTASNIVRYFGWELEGASDLYIWNPEDYYGKFDWPIGEAAHYELLVADEGAVSAPMFAPGDVLAEIEDATGQSRSA
jgi:DNA-binding MarR family transcriptional regulator